MRSRHDSLHSQLYDRRANKLNRRCEKKGKLTFLRVWNSKGFRALSPGPRWKPRKIIRQSARSYQLLRCTNADCPTIYTLPMLLLLLQSKRNFGRPFLAPHARKIPTLPAARSSPLPPTRHLFLPNQLSRTALPLVPERTYIPSNRPCPPTSPSSRSELSSSRGISPTDTPVSRSHGGSLRVRLAFDYRQYSSGRGKRVAATVWGSRDE
jgi:hypothetical protein